MQYCRTYCSFRNELSSEPAENYDSGDLQYVKSFSIPLIINLLSYTGS